MTPILSYAAVVTTAKSPTTPPISLLNPLNDLVMHSRLKQTPRSYLINSLMGFSRLEGIAVREEI